MIDPKDVHIVLIGNERVYDYYLNMEILRDNFSFGHKLWITTVYNGDVDKLISGIGENTFIHIPENRGYGLGALDAFNYGLDFASTLNREYVALFNFDVFFFDENLFLKLLSEFSDSGHYVGAGYNDDLMLPMTDIMLFRGHFLKKILPLVDTVDEKRKSEKKLIEKYNGTSLGFENMEEWVYCNIEKFFNNENDFSDWLFTFARDGAPRYRWTEKYSLGHIHSFDEKKFLLKKYNLKNGKMINTVLNRNFNDSENSFNMGAV